MDEIDKKLMELSNLQMEFDLLVTKGDSFVEILERYKADLEKTTEKIEELNRKRDILKKEILNLITEES